MNTSFKSAQTNMLSHASLAKHQGKAVRRDGAMRAVVLDDSSFGTDSALGMERAVQESVDNAFGISEFTSLFKSH